MTVHHLKVVPGRKTPAERREDLRKSLWPESDTEVWNRKKEKGFCTIPRTLSLTMTLIDDLLKGKDASHVYLDIWCRSFDEGLVEVSDEEAFAFSSGYTSSRRSVRTWRERIEFLNQMGFIRVHPHGNRKFGYFMLRHPHLVIKELKVQGKIPDQWWAAYVKRASEIGAELP